MRKLLSILISFLVYIPLTFGQSHTQFSKNAVEYARLLNALEKMLTNSSYSDTMILGGEERHSFVLWIRDHVHVMKAMKYLYPDMTSYLEFYLENQTPEGIYFDYLYPMESRISSRLNIFDKRYWKVFPQDTIQMHRLPVEADLEYLIVEGVYAVWQSKGDKAFVEKWLPTLVKGMNYDMSDPLRWSARHQLVKRGYTLDTWDFMQLPTTREEYTRQGGDIQKGIFNIDKNTPMGIMHGDNSGMYAACRQLAHLYEALGNTAEAQAWDHEAETFRLRTNALCWNGKYYAHFVEDDPQPPYLRIDQKNTLSLSNPYDINRGLPTQEMSASIIQTYQDLKAENQANSFAEWYGVYPAVEPHFADYEPGSYMNGGVNTIVGGELAKAAFQHGFESYGVDILNRMLALVDKHDGDLPVAYRPDGTVDEGIPDNWGQAAVYNALIEGLAGVVDQNYLFHSVEISPRWMAAGVDEVEVSVVYGPSKKQITYAYQYQKSAKKIHLKIKGDAEQIVARILLPEGVRQATARVNGKDINTNTDTVQNSNYLVIKSLIGNTQAIEVSF